MPLPIIVIGSGIGGLSAAIRLAAAGRQVTLLEKNATLGGKLNLWDVPHPHRPSERFRFDTGPSLLTLPQIFDDLFTAAGRRLADYLTLQRLDPIARFSWRDGQTFSLYCDPVARWNEVARFSPPDLPGWKKIEQRGREIWDLSADLFLFRAPEQMLAGKSFRQMLAAATTPFRIGMFSRFSSLIDRHIASEKLRAVLYQYATYSGASPFKGPGTLAVIPHAEMHFGGWHIAGGMYRLAEALEKLARELGVQILTSSPVSAIDIDLKAGVRSVTGVRLADGRSLSASGVIANSDVVYTYRKLIAPEHRPRFSNKVLQRLDPGGSGLVLLLGVEGEYPQLVHHNKFMPQDYRDDLRVMQQRDYLPVDPCIYVCAPCRTDPSVAPEGCENLFILASAPALDGSIDWATQAPAYADRLIETLENRWNLSDLRRRILLKRIISPADLQSLYNANAGSIYGIGSNSRRTAFLRPPNRDRHVRGLFFVGGATHPGGGLPLVELSGKIVSEMILKES